MKNIVKKAVKRAKASKPKKRTVQKKRARPIDTDSDLEGLLKQYGARIKVVGTGGSGNNTLQRLLEIGVHGIESIAMNTDAQQLLSTTADKKLLLGRKLTNGLGAGSDPDVGEAAAKESLQDISDLLRDTDLVFITCGLGGGTGTGSASVIAESAKGLGALTVGVVTLPFTVEGRRRMDNAMEGLAKLKKQADTVIVIPNDKLLEVAPDLPITSAFRVADEILTNGVKGITDLITQTGLVNLDYADLRTVLNRCGPAMIGLGESNKDSSLEARALDAVENALTSPLLDVDISDATRALVNVSGGSDMTLKEAELIVDAVASKIHPNAHIIWGAFVDEEMAKREIQAMVVIGGGKIPYLEALKADKDALETGNKALDIGLDYVVH